MLRRAGLDPDTALLATAEVAEQRDIQRWLPLALASLYGLVSAAYGSKSPPTIPEAMRLWGLYADADRIDALLRRGKEAAAVRAVDRFFGAPQNPPKVSNGVGQG